ncbi:MAG: S24 family peptidase [Alteromonadaceae bacterium]|nr:S24 family peptidase [Alteromonadaceae bacterium]
MKIIPIYIQAGISGFESPAAEYKELGLSLDQLLISNPDATFIGLAQGQSMQGVGIYENDLLIIDRAKNVKTGDVIVANYNGCFVCKILDKEKAMLLSASVSFAAVKINETDEFQVEGVVTRSIRMHQPASEILSCML